MTCIPRYATLPRIGVSLAFLLFELLPAHAQVFEVVGGSSSLYQTQGGTFLYRAANTEASFGAGITAGRVLAGGLLTRVSGPNTYYLGQQTMQFNLLTDIFDTSHYLMGLGAGLHTHVGATDMRAFGGALSQQYDSPYFNGARGQQAAAVILLNAKLGDRFTSATQIVGTINAATAIESIGWRPNREFALAASGGVGDNHPYAAISLDECKRWIDVKAAYIETSRNFQRAPAGMPITAEPERENILVTLHPTQKISISGGRQNFLTPVYGETTNQQSSIDDISGDYTLEGATLSASLFHSTYAGQSNSARSYSLSRDFGPRFHGQASYFQSRSPGYKEVDTALANVQETVSPRITLNQQVMNSNGQTTLGFGGSLLSNLATLSVTYQTYYVPAEISNPFQNIMLIDSQIHLFGRVSLHVANFVAPDGHVLYSADVSAVFARQSINDGTRSVFDKTTIGSMAVCGKVVDRQGNAIDGAAIQIDGAQVFSNETGQFCMRESKQRTHQLKVLGSEFLDGRTYSTVSAPSVVKSEPADEQNDGDTVIVVQSGNPVTP